MILHVLPWPSGTITDKDVYRADSLYVETMWLPILGPTATWALRRLARGLERWPSGYLTEVEALATSLGVKASAAWDSPMSRSLRRLEKFGVARMGMRPHSDGPKHWDQPTIAVRQHLPPLSSRQLDHLPPWMHGGNASCPPLVGAR